MKFNKIIFATLLLAVILSLSVVSASDDFAGDDISANEAGGEILGDEVDDFQGYVTTDNIDISDINETVGVRFYCPEGYEGNVTIDFGEDSDLENIIYPVNESVWNTTVEYKISDLGITKTGEYGVNLFFNENDEWQFFLAEGWINVVDNTQFWVYSNISFAWPQPIDMDLPFPIHYPAGSAGKDVRVVIKREGEQIAEFYLSTTVNDTDGFISLPWKYFCVYDFDLSYYGPTEYTFTFYNGNDTIYESSHSMTLPLWPWEEAYIGGEIDAQTVASVALDPRITEGQVILSFDGEEVFNKNLSEIWHREIEGGPNTGRYEYQILIDDLNTTLIEGDYHVDLTFKNENYTLTTDYIIKIHEASVVTDNDTNVSIIILTRKIVVPEYEEFIQLVTPLNTTGNLTVNINGTEYFNAPLSELEDYWVTDDSVIYSIWPDFFESVDPGLYDVNVTFTNENKTFSNWQKIAFLSVVDPEVVSSDFLCDDDINYFAYVGVLEEYDINGNVIILLNGTEYFNKAFEDFGWEYTIYDGNTFYIITPAYLDTPVEPGTYEVELLLSDYSRSASGIVTFYDDNINIEAPDVIKYFGGPERFYVNITDNAANPIANATVNITINGKTYTKVTDENGTASIALGLNTDYYDVLVKCNDTEVRSEVIVLSTVSGDNIIKMFRNATQYYATFYDSQGKALGNNTEVEFNINGVFYKRYTNENGTARMNINLNPGEYEITAKNPVTGEMYTNLITVLSTIVDNYDLVKYYKNDSQYFLRILDDEGNPVKEGVEVTFNINGVFYKRYTNEEGTVRMNINLEPGEYVITAEYNGLMASNNITVLSVIETENMTMKFQDGSSFNATILNGQGKPLANANVTFNINGVFYNKVTDENGVAHLKINLMAGEYIITTTYNGLNAANKITITS